jgi:hypothetical protein
VRLGNHRFQPGHCAGAVSAPPPSLTPLGRQLTSAGDVVRFRVCHHAPYRKGSIWREPQAGHDRVTARLYTGTHVYDRAPRRRRRCVGCRRC